MCRTSDYTDLSIIPDGVISKCGFMSRSWISSMPKGCGGQGLVFQPAKEHRFEQEQTEITETRPT
jgi:hypothetical protein